MKELLLAWVHMVLAFLAEPSVARAIFFALLGGVMLTQWFKFQLPEWLSDGDHERLVRLGATALTNSLCMVLWPDPFDWSTAAISFVTGLTAPTAYWLAVKALYHYFPWTEDMLSARPGAKP